MDYVKERLKEKCLLFLYVLSENKKNININTFIFVLDVFLTDILHYITATHPAFLTFSSHLLIYL